MKRLLFALLVAALALTVAATAKADTYLWAVSGIGNDITGFGTLTTGAELATDIYDITGMDGTFTDTINGINGTVADPFTASSSLSCCLTSPDGKYYYDNLLYTSSGLFFDSSGGVLFNVNGGAGVVGGGEVNIAGINGGYQLWETKPGSTYLPPGIFPGYTVDFDVTATPEPTTFTMIGGVLLVGLGIFGRRKFNTR